MDTQLSCNQLQGVAGYFTLGRERERVDDETAAAVAGGINYTAV